MPMKRLLSHPLFSVGLLIRLALMFTVVPLASSNWYAPFLDSSITYFSLDPWAAWLHRGGTPVAFPYGYVMWLVFLPASVLCKLAGAPLMVGYGCTLLAADVALMAVLRKMFTLDDRLLLLTYWLSPIVLLASYVFGLNDVVPVLLLTLSLWFTRQLRMLPAGIFCVAAISAKLSMILALPFFLIYLSWHPALRQLLPAYLKGAAIAALAFGLPFIVSASGVHMLVSNPEIGKIFQFALLLGGATTVYVVPLVYLVMLYAVLRVRRLNFELFYAMLGMAFLLVVLMTPASPGWFIWALPLLVFYQAMSGKIALMLTGAFSALYALATVLETPEIGFVFGATNVTLRHLPGLFGKHAISLLHTGMTAVGVVLALRIWRETVSANDYFRLSRKPFVVGIAGDSGAGKDTLAEALRGLFGAHSVTHLSGDDYHLWDRNKPMWQVITHLNPKANDLEAFANDVLALADGKSIRPRHYDHQTGRMSHPAPLRSNDFIIASSLHALYLPALRQCYNLSIYLDIDEGLRRYYKMQRDVGQRGHTSAQVSASMHKREPDAVRYVRPQSGHADLVLALQPIHPRLLDGEVTSEPLRVKLWVRARNGLNEISLTRVLVGICGLHVDVHLGGDGNEVSLTIEGETSAKDIALAASMLFPRILEFLDVNPEWKDGVLGLMQLVTLAHVNQALNRRLIDAARRA